MSTDAFSVVVTMEKKSCRECNKMRIRTLTLACFFILWFLPGTAPAAETLEGGQNRIDETMILIPATEMKAVLGLEKEGIFVTYD